MRPMDLQRRCSWFRARPTAINTVQRDSPDAQLTGYTGEVRWNASKPNGQPRRSLDTTRAQEAFGFASTTAFADGLRETIRWYNSAFVAPRRP
jgi:nucleoside-diphosphate-sugar epimerase